MGYQLLQGVQITPKGAYNVSRFSQDFVNGSWPNSFAFGGWIYNTEVNIGFSSQPTEIRVSIVLEVIDKAQKYAFFNIEDNDLRCDAGNGGDENLYDFNFNGITFTDFILYEKEIAIESNTKILNVTFRDYSCILDKIYVGLLKRQGAVFVHTASSTLTFPVRCPDCLLAGDSFTQIGDVKRDIAFGSYVGMNGQVYDNFETVDDTVEIFSQWVNFFGQTPAAEQFDLNGGYLIIGTEEATEERCGNLANMTYNFNELLASLRYRGLNFTGAFPVAITDADYIYKQNYIGTVREIMQQWCSDLGYDFYCEGKNFVGINLNRALNISKVVEIADPTTDFGSQFSLNKETAILSYKITSTLNNTFRQSVITANNRARDSKIDSKSPKRYVGILPLHPIDFNQHSTDLTLRYDALGTFFYDVAWANNFEIDKAGQLAADRLKTLPLLDNRTLGDIDTAIALTRYDDSLRDIFCQDRAIYGDTAEIRASNFRALGFVPLIEVTGDAMSPAIEALVPNAGGGDEVSNICLDKRYYRVYIGYSYSNFKQDVIAWEQAAGDSMYKYGIVTDGLLNYFPYMPQNSLQDISPVTGFYGQSGTSLLREQHTVEPSCNQYFQLRDAPFKDLILYSGLLNPSFESLDIPLNQLTGTVFPQGLFYAQLDNDWGTELEEFKRNLTLLIDDPCETEFAQYQDYTSIKNNIPKKFQDWRLDTFRPQSTPDIEKFYSDFLLYFQKLDTANNQNIFDRAVGDYYNLHYKELADCSKLHIMVLTDTRNHPNISVDFTQYGTQFINGIVLRGYVDKEREAVKRRIQTKTQSICDITLLQEMCKNIISGGFNSNTGDARYRCIIDEDKYNFLEDGFPLEDLLIPNSRGLGISIVKNPQRNNNTDKIAATFQNADVNGDFYYSDIASNALITEQRSINMNIVYPVSFGSVASYRGVLTSQVDFENRTPEIIDIFGSPTNITNNRAINVKVINNQVDPDLQPQLDPFFQRFMSYMTVITGTGQVVTTVEQYHNLVANLNNYQLTGAMKSVDITLAGTPDTFGDFQAYLSPINGLNKLSISVNDNGVTTSLSFADRPPQLPKQESILNKIGPRIK